MRREEIRGQVRMKLVISVWNNFDTTESFEAQVQLKFLAHRARFVGINDELHVLFLKGISGLDKNYIDQLDDLGVRLYDCQNILSDYEELYSRLVCAYRNWGGIKHYGLFRFLIIPKIFPGEDIIFFDADILPNCNISDFLPYKENTFILAHSTCFGHITDDSWWETVRYHIDMLGRKPEKYVKKFTDCDKVDDFLNPAKVGGSDQAIIGNMARKKIIRDDEIPFFSSNTNIVLFPNWLHLGLAKKPWVYERHDGIDYLDGKKVAVSHMSNDFCSYLSFWYWIHRVMQYPDFGRLPAPYFGLQKDASAGVSDVRGLFSDAHKLVLYRFIGKFFKSKLKKTNYLVESLNENPYTRGGIARYFYSQSDFSPVFDNSSWWDQGTFKS